MHLSINGLLSAVSKDKPKWGSGGHNLQLKMKNQSRELIQDGLLHGKYKTRWISIDPGSNEVMDGLDLIERLKFGVTVKKFCQTCDFKLVADARNQTQQLPHMSVFEQMVMNGRFPKLTLQHERLNFTMKRGKHVSISNYYQQASSLPGTSDSKHTDIVIRKDHDSFRLPSVYIDMTKITDIENLTRRLKTIMVFQ